MGLVPYSKKKPKEDTKLALKASSEYLRSKVKGRSHKVLKREQKCLEIVILGWVIRSRATYLGMNHGQFLASIAKKRQHCSVMKATLGKEGPRTFV